MLQSFCISIALAGPTCISPLGSLFFSPGSSSKLPAHPAPSWIQGPLGPAPVLSKSNQNKITSKHMPYLNLKKKMFLHAITLRMLQCLNRDG